MAATENRELVVRAEDSRNLLQHTEESCSKVKEQGLVVGKYETLLDCFTEPTDPLLNGYFVHSVKFSNAKSIFSLCKQIAEKQKLFDINNSLILNRFLSAVLKLMRTVKQLRKKQIYNWHRLVELLNTPFCFNNSNEVKDTKKQNSLEVQNFFKCCVDPSSSAGKQMTTNGLSKYGLRIKPICTKCQKSNKALLQSKKTIKNLRQKWRCLPKTLPKIEKLQQALLSTSTENEKLMSKLKAISDMHHDLLIKVKLNNIEIEQLKAENATLKAENKRLVEENTTMNEKLSTEVKEQGIVVGNYNSLLDCFTEPTDPLLTGYIVRSIQYSIVKNRNLVCKQIIERQALFDIKNSVILKRFIISVSRLMKKVQCLRRRLIINWHKLVELFNTPFSFNKSNEVKDIKKRNSLEVQSFFKCVDASSSAGKQMTTNGESKYGLRIKPSCSKCQKSNKALLQSKKTIKNLRQKWRCLPKTLPKIQKLEQALLSTYRENEKLMSKLQAMSDVHHNLLIKVQLNDIEIEELKAENATLKAENKKLVEENTTMNEKLSTELILPFAFKMS